jgi:hypothetical protein
MTSPQFPGQSGLDRLRQQQDQMRRDQQRRQQMAAWQSSQRKIDERRRGDRTNEAPVRRLGIVARLVRFLLSLVFFAVMAFAVLMAVVAYTEDDSQGALSALAASAFALVMFAGIRKWGRS